MAKQAVEQSEVEQQWAAQLEVIKGDGFKFGNPNDGASEKMAATGDYYHGGGSLMFYKTKKKSTYRWGNEYETSGGAHFHQGQMAGCCAVPTFHGFTMPLPEKVSVDSLTALLKMGILKNSKQEYIQASTTTQRMYSKWNKALKLAGFEEVARAPTRHGSGYKAIVWAWKKPEEKASA